MKVCGKPGAMPRSLFSDGRPRMRKRHKYAVEIPGLSSLILTHDLNGEVKGLKAWPKDDRPPVLLVFWPFRIMVGIGLLMSLTGIAGLVLYPRETVVRGEVVSILVHGNDPGWIYRGDFRVVCNGSRQTALHHTGHHEIGGRPVSGAEVPWSSCPWPPSSSPMRSCSARAAITS